LLVSKTIPATLAKGTSTDCFALIPGDFTKLVIGIFGPALDIVWTDSRLSGRT